jgi:hypothetical protein
MRWESIEPISLPDDDSDLVFQGKRYVVASDELCKQLNLGPRTEYLTRFTFKRGWALAGIYSGPDGGGPFGDISFYAARR